MDCLDANAVQVFARRYGLDWDNPRGISRIIVRSEVAGGLATGQNHEILTYAHSLAVGQIVQGSAKMDITSVALTDDDLATIPK